MSGQNPVAAAGDIKKVTAAEQENLGADLKPGELQISQSDAEVKQNDATALFMGDGQTQFSSVAARILELNSLRDPLFDEFQGNDVAAKYMAEVALRSPSNRKLLERGLSADSLVPNGELFTVKHSELKRALAPFKGRLGELRSALANLQPAGSGMSAEQGRTIGRVGTPAQGLPIDPNI